MATFFITCLVHCCTYVLAPDPSWKNYDNEALNRAQHRCAELYEHSTCLTKFTKMEPRVYRAVCGPENN